jgi:hypothetical protein
MATTIEPRITLFELPAPSGEVVATLLAFSEMARVRSGAAAMAREMASAARSHLIDKGCYLHAVQFSAGASLERHRLFADLSAGANTLAQPARQVTQVAFFASKADSTRAIGCMPALGVVASVDASRLRSPAVEAIFLEYRRKGQLAEVRKQISAAWFERVELRSAAQSLAFHCAEAARQLRQKSEPALKGVIEVCARGILGGQNGKRLELLQAMPRSGRKSLTRTNSPQQSRRRSHSPVTVFVTDVGGRANSTCESARDSLAHGFGHAHCGRTRSR